jgi:hypothetical protein
MELTGNWTYVDTNAGEANPKFILPPPPLAEFADFGPYKQTPDKSK